MMKAIPAYLIKRRRWISSYSYSSYSSSSIGGGFLSEKDFHGTLPISPSPSPTPGSSPSVSTSPNATTTTSRSTTTTTTTTSTFTPPKVEYSFKMGTQLSKYGVDLTRLAIEGKVDTVIGRDREIQQAIQILSRRRKNNPCLIGEPGVGKTAIAEGLAYLIAKDQVPDSMKHKAIISLDLASMLAGTKFRGEFEDRLKGCLKEIEQAGDKIILFIDELHVIVGTGGAEGGIDASNILKPPLARGLIRCLGTTTIEEYNQYIEKDAALARRFQAIFVPEPSQTETIQIVQGLRWKYESHHSIQIPDDTIEAAVKLSAKYLTSRKFPDKAIDLIDEAAARLRNRIESKPNRLVQVEQLIDNAKGRIYEHLLAGREVTVKEELDIYRLEEEARRLRQAFQRRREVLGNIFELKHIIENIEEEVKSLRQQQQGGGGGGGGEGIEKITSRLKEITDYQHRIVEMYQELHHSHKDCGNNGNIGGNSGNIDNIDNNGKNGNSGNIDNNGKNGNSGNNGLEVFTNSLTVKDIAEIISQSTGIPIESMIEHDERQALLQMEKMLSYQVIGQNEAISTIAKCIRLSRAGLRYHDRPIGVFLFLGPTGVGKTELAKAVASILFKDHHASSSSSTTQSSSLLRIDMSEYMERFSVSRLIGAPPGYVGYDEGGILTDAIRRRPYQLLLLDEFEKAHREVSNLLLQVFDEEFVNRLDDVIVFNSLNQDALLGICTIQLDKVKKVLKEKGITFHASTEALQALIQSTGDLQYGARPLKRVIQNSILTPLASCILEDSLREGDEVYLSIQGNAIGFSKSMRTGTDGYEAVVFVAPEDDLGLEFAMINKRKKEEQAIV
eukprot:gene526-565_t